MKPQRTRRLTLDRERLDFLRPVIESRLADFSSIPREKWAREVLFCLLTPQTSPFHAEACLCELESAGLFEGMLAIRDIEKGLANKNRYVRFHREKAKRIKAFLGKYREIEDLLFAGMSPMEEREHLLALVKGLGWKEASHALRNIGRRNLAILDRHILRNLARLGVIRSVPVSLSEKVYKEIESRFAAYARQQGESMDVLDLFFWAGETGLLFK